MADFQKIDIEKVNASAVKWGNYVKPQIQSQIQRLGLMDRMSLFNSIKVKIKKSAGLVEVVAFEYAWYGLFHNTGASNAFAKGVTLPALHWKSKAINPNIEALASEVANGYADAVINATISQRKNRL